MGLGGRTMKQSAGVRSTRTAWNALFAKGPPRYDLVSSDPAPQVVVALDFTRFTHEAIA